MRLLTILRASTALRRLSIGVVMLCIGGVPAAASTTVNVKRLWTYAHAQSNAPGQKSEIVAYDDRTDTLWVAGVAGVDVLNRSWGQLVAHIDVTAYGAVNSVAIHDGLAALAIEAAPDRTQPGVVVFMDTRTRQRLGQPVIVGALPDMLTFTPDGRTVLVADEATPNPRIAGQPCPADPPGGVTLIDAPTRAVSSMSPRGAATLPVSASLPGYSELRLFPLTGNGATRPDMCPYDPEPEYIAVDHAGHKAYVGLQEANGVAVLDLKTRQFERIFGLGLKDFSLPANAIDPHDQENGLVAFRQAPVKGLYQPDAIAAYQHQGRTYLVMANEGDARDNGSGDGEDERRGSAGNASIELVPEGNLLSRLTLSNVESTRANLVAFGGRSFSIRDAEGRIVFDSGNQLDVEAFKRGIYDDSRSDNKGVEPEGVALMHIEGRVLAFIGMERTTKSAVAIYDVTDPNAVGFVDMIVSDSVLPDVSPEGLTAFRVGSRYFLAVANEVSDSTSLFEVGIRRTSSSSSASWAASATR
ncbi:choice-of-anchor I family protein [Methylocystis sp. S23]